MRVVLADGDAPEVVLARDGDAPPSLQPGLLDFSRIAGASASSTTRGHFRLQSPPGWHAEACGPLRWRVRPRVFDPDRPALFRIDRISDDVSLASQTTVSTPFRLDLRSRFEPATFALPIRNRAEHLGEVRPSRETFNVTFPHMPARLARLLFEGIYSDIVFLTAQGPRRGGLCSGMARWAIARSLGAEPAPRSTDDAVRRISIYHGRQMRDRALLSALPWFLRGSPKAAYRAVRRDLFVNGVTDRALDIGVPKLWRRDVLQSLVAEGHTVVPIRLRQDGPGRGLLEVYDPNHPEAIGSDTPRTIDFDLENDRYGYGNLAKLSEHNVGIIAVRQTAYASTGSAIIATVGSLLLNPVRGLRSLVGSRRAREPASGPEPRG